MTKKPTRPSKTQQRALANACALKDLSTADINRRRARALADLDHVETEINRLAQELATAKDQRASLCAQVEGADMVLGSR